MVPWLYRKGNDPCIKRPHSDSFKTICSRFSILCHHLGLLNVGNVGMASFFFFFAYKQMYVYFSTSTAPYSGRVQGLLYKTLSKIHCPKCVYSHTSGMCLCVKERVFPCRTYVRKTTCRATRLSSDGCRLMASSSSTLLQTQGNPRLFGCKYDCSLQGQC